MKKVKILKRKKIPNKKEIRKKKKKIYGSSNQEKIQIKAMESKYLTISIKLLNSLKVLLKEQMVNKGHTLFKDT